MGKFTPSGTPCSTNYCSKKYFKALIYPLIVIFLLCSTFFSWSQKAKATLEQVRNGTATSPLPGAWVSGNLNASQSHFAENWSIPYRLVMTGLSSGSHYVIIEWDTRQGGKNALDFITQFDLIDNAPGSHITTFGHPQEVIDPKIGYSSLPAGIRYQLPRPNDVAPTTATSAFDGLTKPDPGTSKTVMTIYNGSINSMLYASEGSLSTSASTTQLRINFTAPANNSTVILAWGGHIAAEADWGPGNSASSISGSPYHMRLIEIDGSGGNQDRSLSADAVIDPPKCTVDGNSPVSCGTSNNYSVSLTMESGYTYTWTLSNNTSGATIAGADANGTKSGVTTISVNAGTVGTTSPCSKNYTVNFIVFKNGTEVSRCTKVVAVQDITPPTVIAGTIGACYSSVAAAEAAAKAATTYSDNCAANANLTVSANTTGSCSAVVTVTVTDPCGNANSVSYNTRIDNTAPVLSSTPPNTTVSCHAIPEPPDITANDVCDGVVTVNYNQSSTKGANPAQCSYYNYTITRSWSAQDGCGNSVTHTQTLTVQDDSKPTVTKGSIGACYSTVKAAEDAALATTSYSDNCAPNANLNVSVSTTGTCNAVFTVTVTDPCGNTNTVSYDTRIDNTPPVLSATPANTTVSCNAIPAVPTITATDECDGTNNVTYSSSKTQGTDPALCSYYNYTITRTWSAQDGCGNPVTYTQTITVQDDSKPTLTKGTINSCYASVAAAEAAAKAATTYSDVCAANNNLQVAVSTTGSCSAVVTVTVTDPCGNTNTVSYDTRIDNTAPVLSSTPPNTTVSCHAIPEPPDITANDVCDGVVTVNYNQSSSKGTNPAQCSYYNYTITRTWSAQDGCGNLTTYTQTITVQDNTAPAVTKGSMNSCYASVAAAEAAAKAATTYSDACAENDYLQIAVSTTGTCNSVVTVTVTDPCGNANSVNYDTRIDNTPPELSATPANTTVSCNVIPSVPTITANDACQGTVNVTFSSSKTQGTDPTQCSYYNYTITRTWSAQDGCGNLTTYTQTITVQDNTAPAVTKGSMNSCYASVAAAEAAAKAATTYGDNCAVNANLTVSASTTGTCTATVTVTVTDPCGNSNSVSYNTKIDYTPPVINCPADIKVNLGASIAPAATGTPTATDNCDGAITPTYTDAPAQSLNCYKLIVRTWTAVDGCGNTSTCIQKITVVDIVEPVMTCPPDVQLNCSQDAANLALTGSPTVSDNSGAVIQPTYTDALVGMSACSKPNIIRTWTAIDPSGNIKSCTQNITFVSQTTMQVQSGGVKEVSNRLKGKPGFDKLSETVLSKELQVRAYPNPYKNSVNFQLISPVSGKTTLELYDLLGRRLITLYQGNLEAGVQKTINYKVPGSRQQPLIYKITVGNQSSIGKLLPDHSSTGNEP